MNESVNDETLSPSRKKQKTDQNPVSSTQSDSTNYCPICLDSWSGSGNHRIVSLKCGHLFGQVCVEKWLTQNPKCPQCNGAAKKFDIRPIYATGITVVDNSELDSAVKLYEAEKRKKNNLEQLHLKATIHCELLASENLKMRKRIRELEYQLRSSEHVHSTISLTNGHGKYMFAKSVLVSAGKTAHVVHSDPHSGMIVVSKKFEDSLSMYGVLKISSLESTHHEFVKLHNNQIRDVCFDPHGKTTLLSCSKEKDIKLTCLKTNSTVLSYPVRKDAWSCSWSMSSSYQMYCGLQNGEVMVYDIRNTREHLSTILPILSKQKCPVISVSSIPVSVDNVSESLLVSTLQGISIYKKYSDNEFQGELLKTPAGAISSVSFQPENSKILASYKPGARTPKERHILMNLTLKEKAKSHIEIVHTFEGGSRQHLRSRTCLVKCPDDDNHLLVCAGDQSSNVFRIWSTKDMSEVQCCGSHKESGGIIAIGPHRAAGVDYICVLTNQRLTQYKWLVAKSHFDSSNEFDLIA